jgi:hypothetical protein
VAAYGGERRAQLVAGVGSEAPLALQGFFPAGEGGLEAREEAVYRGGETPDLVPGVGHGQPLREVTLTHLPGGARHGVYGSQGRSCQEVSTADGQEEGRADAGRQHGTQDLEGILSGLVGSGGLHHPRGSTRRIHRYGVDVIGIVARQHSRPRGGLPRTDSFPPHAVARAALGREVRRLEDVAASVAHDHGDPVEGELFDVVAAQELSGLDGTGGRDRTAPGGVLDVGEQRAPAQEIEREAKDEQDRADHQRDKERQAPPDRQGRSILPSGRTRRP